MRRAGGGGELVLLCAQQMQLGAGGAIFGSETFTAPTYNRLTLFVTHGAPGRPTSGLSLSEHAVMPVVDDAHGERLAVTGWFTSGDE